MSVNAYLIWDPQTLDAALFDTGANAQEALAAVDELGLNLQTANGSEPVGREKRLVGEIRVP